MILWPAVRIRNIPNSMILICDMWSVYKIEMFEICIQLFYAQLIEIKIYTIYLTIFARDFSRSGSIPAGASVNVFYCQLIDFYLYFICGSIRLSILLAVKCYRVS